MTIPKPSRFKAAAWNAQIGLFSDRGRSAMRAAGYWAAELLERYFRTEVKGLHHVPRKGPVILIANHSSFTAADAIVLAHVLSKQAGRPPRMLAHRGYFEWSPLLRRVSTALGLRKANLLTGIRLLQQGHLLVLFPEGEAGNFKPSTEGYHLRPFHDGFARMARQTGATVVPCVILGAEEAHFNLGALEFEKLLVPVPLNLFPLPSKWRIRFLRPLRIGDASSREHSTVGIARKARARMQAVIGRELAGRKYVYFPFLRTFAGGIAVPARVAMRPRVAARGRRAA